MGTTRKTIAWESLRSSIWIMGSLGVTYRRKPKPRKSWLSMSGLCRKVTCERQRLKV